MNTEQFQAQQAAAVAIEAGVHAVAAVQVRLNNVIERATEAATTMMAIKFQEHTGYLPREMKLMADELRPAIGGAVAKFVEQTGAERFASLMTDAGADMMGEAYAIHMLERTEHKMVDLGRRMAKSSSDRDARTAPTFDDVLIERTAAPSVNHAPVSYTPKSAADILVGIEHREAASGRQFPAKRKK